MTTSRKTKNIERELWQTEIDKCNAKIFKLEKELKELNKNQIKNIFHRLELVELYKNRLERLEHVSTIEND